MRLATLYHLTVNEEHRLKIAITSFYLPSESKIGVGWASHRLANALVKLGHDVTVISPCEKPLDAKYGLLQIPLRGKIKTFKWGYKLRKVDWSKFEVLLAQGDDHLVPSKTIPVHIRTFHGSCFDEALRAKGFFKRMRMFLLGLTELMSSIRTPIKVGVSYNSIRWYPWISIVIPNGVDVDTFYPPSEEEKAEYPTVLFVGTYEGRKRGQLLQKVFVNEILPVLPKAKLWMVCSDAPRAKGVEVFGKITDAHLSSLYRKAWIFCLPSTYEGFGIPYIESLVSGLYVVATPNKGAKEILQSLELGCISDSRNLGSTLLELLESNRPRKVDPNITMAQRKRYSIEQVALSYLDLINLHYPNYNFRKDEVG